MQKVTGTAKIGRESSESYESASFDSCLSRNSWPDSARKSAASPTSEASCLPQVQKRLRACLILKRFSSGARELKPCVISADLRLQVLFCPVANTLKRFVQVLHGVGNAEAQVAFTKLSERRTGETRHACFIQQSFRQFLGCPASLLYIRESVERAVREAAAKALDIVQTGDELIAPRMELLTHVVNGCLIALERFHGRHLGKAGAA